MISAILLVFAVVAGSAGGGLLARARWTTRAPALGILAWQCLTWSVITSLLLAGAGLALPQLPAGDTIAEFFHACTVALRDHYSAPGGGLLAILGGTTSLVLVGRLVFYLGSQWRAARRARTAHADLLACVGTPENGVVLVEHASPAVYCFPGRPATIVVTTAARDALSSTQMSQVLAHERAHLRARHHLALLAARAIAATLGSHLGSGLALEKLEELVEMHADDAADPRARHELAQALVLLAGGGAPTVALAAAMSCSVARVHRLAAPSVPVSYRSRSVIVLTLVLLVAAPPVILSSPLLADTVLAYCPLPFA
jgi:Zn-dependent protease with chaperone function